MLFLFLNLHVELCINCALHINTFIIIITFVVVSALMKMVIFSAFGRNYGMRVYSCMSFGGLDDSEVELIDARGFVTNANSLVI